MKLWTGGEARRLVLTAMALIGLISSAYAQDLRFSVLSPSQSLTQNGLPTGFDIRLERDGDAKGRLGLNLPSRGEALNEFGTFWKAAFAILGSYVMPFEQRIGPFASFSLGTPMERYLLPAATFTLAVPLNRALPDHSTFSLQLGTQLYSLSPDELGEPRSKERPPLGVQLTLGLRLRF